MALPYPINATQTDAKSPVDDNLMDSIREDLNYLDSAVLSVSSFDYQFKVNGVLQFLEPKFGLYKRLDGGYIVKAGQITVSRLLCEAPGAVGTLEVDLRKYRKTQTPIKSILSQYSSNINSITQIAPNFSTQSITRATSQIATQSITYWKAAINITSIINISGNLWRYNLSSSIDSDWKVGDSVLFSGCSNALNNGVFTVVRINDDNTNNIVVSNPSGISQSIIAGTVQLNAFSYNFINPVNNNFSAGEQALFAGHTSAFNNGNLLIYGTNLGGNNIIVKNSSGVTQAGISGTVDTFRMQFNYSTAIPNDFVVGEYARMSSHSSAINNGDFKIVAVNYLGNNLILYIVGGLTQGIAIGNANTTRWVYALPSNPTTNFTLGQNCRVINATNTNNNGIFSVKEINRGGTDNIVVSNLLGITQVSLGGSLEHTRKIISFFSDESSIYNLDSNIEIYNAPFSGNCGYFNVLEINRGGGSNYNIVVENSSGLEQLNPAGRIEIESKSIYAIKPSLVFPESNFSNTYNNAWLRKFDSIGGAFNSYATFTALDVTNGIILGLDITKLPSGDCSGIVLQLA